MGDHSPDFKKPDDLPDAPDAACVDCPRFIAEASSEMRTPLALVLSPLERVLQSENLSPYERREIELALRQISRIKVEVDLLEDYASLSDHSIRPSFLRGDAVEVLKHLCSKLSHAAEDEGIEIRLKGLKRLSLESDFSILEKVLRIGLLQLLESARSGDSIVCGSEVSGKDALIRLDSMGVASMHRLRNTASLRMEVAMRLMRRLGGKIQVVPNERGTTIEVRVPRIAPQNVRILPIPYVPNEDSVLATRTAFQAARPTLRRSSVHALTNTSLRPHVLVLAENNDLAAYLMEALSHEFDVTCMSARHVSREEIRQLKPDLFMVHRTREDPREGEDTYTVFFTSGIPVMLLGSLPSREVRNLAKKGVIQDYIPMPFTTEDLLARAHVLISRKKSVERLYEALSGTARDVSSLEVRIAIERLETKRAYTKLKEQQKLMQSILNASPMAVFVNDLEGRLVYSNSLYTELFGSGRSVIDLSAESDGDIDPTREMDVLLGGSMPLQRYIAVTDPDGRERFFLSLKFPLFNDSGAPYAICGLATDISERVELEQRKNEFIASASHELKTPVTAMKVLLELLRQRRGALDEIGNEALGRMGSQIDRLTRLVDDLLGLSKLQGHAVQYKMEKIEFVPVVRSAVRSLNIGNARNRIVLSGRKSVEIMADKKHLTQAIRNIIANAIKFSPGRERVEIDIQKETGFLHCAIRDHGVGIRREHLSNIFSCFYRIEDGTRETFPGLGIGLFVTSEIIRGHGGTISVESAPGKGSVFHVYLPLAGRSAARGNIKGRRKSYEKDRSRR